MDSRTECHTSIEGSYLDANFGYTSIDCSLNLRVLVDIGNGCFRSATFLAEMASESAVAAAIAELHIAHDATVSTAPTPTVEDEEAEAEVDAADAVPEEEDAHASAMALALADAGLRMRQFTSVGAADGWPGVLRSLAGGVADVCRRNDVPADVAFARNRVLDDLAESVFQALVQRRAPWIAATLIADNGADAFAAPAKLRPALVTHLNRLLRSSMPHNSSRLVGLIQSELDFSQGSAVITAAQRIDRIAAPTRPTLHIFGSSGNSCGGASSDVDIAIEVHPVVLRSLEMQAAERRDLPSAAQVALGVVETVVKNEVLPERRDWFSW